MVAETPELPMLHANVRQEVGIIVGFIALFIIVTAVFSFLWNSKNKHHDKLEVERQRDLKAQGWGLQGWERLGRDKTRDDTMGGVIQHAERVDDPEQQYVEPKSE